jgi:replicative DNA helicase
VDIERLIVTKIASSGEIERLVSAGVASNHYASPDCREVYDYMLDHLRKYRGAASYEAIKKKFPKFDWAFTTDTLEFLIDEFISQIKRRETISMLRDLADAVDDPGRVKRLDEEALEMARNLAMIVPSNKSARFSDMPRRIEDYRRKALSGDAWGIKMNIPTFDRLTYGIQPHEFIAVIGYQGTGKSSLLEYLAFQAYLQDKTTLFISLEMEAEALYRRFDTMAMHFNYDHLKGLELSDKEIEHWEKVAETAASHRHERDIIVLDDLGRASVEKVYAEMARYKPDVCMVDYISLMSAPTTAGQGWERVGEITKGLKINARSLKTPIIAAAQTNRESAKAGPELDNIAFASSIGMDTDMILGLHQDDEMRDRDRMEIRMLKNRDGDTGKVKMNWDMTTRQFYEVSELDDFGTR